MKILVMSDSHGDSYSCKTAIRKHRDAQYLIHLGDGEEDLDLIYPELRNIKLVRVRGNRTFFSEAPLKYILNTCGKRIYCSHGYIEDVKNTLDGLTAAVRAERCDIALYGHTHVQEYHRDGDLHVFNPGSIRTGKYGILEIGDMGEVRIHLMALR